MWLSSDDICHSFSTYTPHHTLGWLGIPQAEGGIKEYLKELVPPVLACFADNDSRVRYYACEAMYNISKVARTDILEFFNRIFDGLSKVGGSRC